MNLKVARLSRGHTWEGKPHVKTARVKSNIKREVNND
jgi:hypothetical protein